MTEPSRSSIDDEVEALASKRDDAQAALRAAQDAYAEACARRDGRVSSESEDEADILFNASPYVDVRCEYGYIQSNAGLYIDISKTRPPGVPRNALELATENFARELEAMKASFRGDEDVPGNGEPVILADREVSTEERELMSELRDRLNTLTLSNDAIWERERARPEVPAPLDHQGALPRPVLLFRLRLSRGSTHPTVLVPRDGGADALLLLQHHAHDVRAVRVVAAQQ